MAWMVTQKNIKIHTCIDGIDSVEDEIGRAHV